MHHCLIKGYNLKRAISNLTTPQSHTPITLKDDKGNIITDPTLLCQTMGETFATLGGPKDFNIDPNVIDELMANSPSIPADHQSPSFTKDFFDNILASANPTTAPGLDETNFFLFHISPPHIKHFLFSACSYLIHNPIPNQWLRAKVIPLFKKGDPQIPSNYRPISLLTSIYKVLASYATHVITFLTLEHSLLSSSPFGGLPNHRCTDHIFSMISNLSTDPDLYHLYLDLNKAFNSVPHQALFQILRNYNFPPLIITLIQQLYSYPADLASVNNHTLHEAMSTRGLRQGCPLSPILFCLFIDPIIRHLLTLLPPKQQHLYAFIDDLALQSSDLKILHTILNFLFHTGPKYGLLFNQEKSELHALNNTPHVTIRISPHIHFSTYVKSGNPRTHYKYLGTYFFNKTQNKHMHSLLTNTISSFFHDLAPLPLSYTELIKLSNSQLIPSLTYRLIYNSLPENLLNSLDSAIWSYISKQGQLSKLTPTKTKYGNRAHLQLGITSLKLKVHQQTVNHITRYLLKEGPKPTNEAVLFALSQPTPAPNLLQSFSVDSANFINISLHNVPNSNPAPLTTIPLYTTIQVQFECFLSTTAPTSYSYTRTKTHPTPSQRWATGTIIKQNPTSTGVDFGDAIMTLKLHHRFKVPSHKTLDPSPFSTIPLSSTHSTPFPYPFSSTRSTRTYIQFDLRDVIPLPPSGTLDYWGCHDFIEAIQHHPTGTIIYTDGSNNPTKPLLPSGSAAVITTPSSTLAITSTCPIKGSYPAEIYSVLMLTTFPLHSLPQPIIIPIDNLSTCSTLNYIMSHSHFPLSSSTDPFSFWYYLIWASLNQSKLAPIFVWCKGHVDILGNKVADSIANWIPHNQYQHPNNYLPSVTSPILTIGFSILPGNISYKNLTTQLPQHHHNNIHLSLSNDYFLHSSWFSVSSFKWVNGLFSCKGYKPHFILNDFKCPMCSHIHPLDPLSTLSYCTSTIHLRELFNNTWPLPFRHTVTNWIPTAPRGEVRNYFKTLVPNSLSNLLRTPHRNTTYAHHLNSLTTALQHRPKPLSKALESIRDWFINNPLNLDHLEPHAPDNPWFTPMSDFSTSSSAPTKLTYPKKQTHNKPTNKHPYQIRSSHKTKPSSKFHRLNLTPHNFPNTTSSPSTSSPHSNCTTSRHHLPKLLDSAPKRHRLNPPPPPSKMHESPPPPINLRPHLPPIFP